MLEGKVKKDDRLDQNTFQYCYGHYVTTNQQTLKKYNMFTWKHFESLSINLKLTSQSVLIEN